MELAEKEYLISTDKSLLSIEKICELLARSYWAETRSREKIEASIQNSICYGIYQDDNQVGFARVVTDYVTVYWLCDVIIDEEHRGRGLGKKLLEHIVNCDELRELRGILSTKDAHPLYERYGFIKDSHRFMFRPYSVCD